MASERQLPTDRLRLIHSESLRVGLINNMPDGALEATERQFCALLNAAADGIDVRVAFYALPDVPRADTGRHHVSRWYADLNDLWNSDVDGLIVTGTEPRAANLRDEPFWGSLTKVLDWAEHNTYSTVWSCLAAHAAVLHMDGISRRRLDDKRFGVFESARASAHPLIASAPPHLRMPHSRWNDLPEDALIAHGYRVLTRSANAGVDAFVKETRSLFVFFQGHPEYDAETLLLEYRRDVGRFLRGERETYPPMPEGYFDQGDTAFLRTLQARAVSDRRADLLADFPTADLAAKAANTWRPTAVCLYRNWLRYLRAQKARRLRAS